MKRSGGVTVAAIVLICAGVLVALYGLLAILGAAMMRSMNVPNFSEPREFFIKQGLTVLIAVWGIVTGIGLLRLRRWAWISMLLVAALLIGIAFPPVPRALKLIRETTGIPTISAPGFVGMAYAESAIRIFTLLALGLWWLLLFIRKSVCEQFWGESLAAAHGMLGIAADEAHHPGALSLMSPLPPDVERSPAATVGIEELRMKRSGGVTAAAVVQFFGSGLLILFMGLGSLVLILPRPSNADQNFPVAGLVVGLLFYGLLAAWGIVTAVGILKLRQWARISILVMSGFAAVGILFACLGILLVAPIMRQTPGVDPGLAKVIEVIWGVVLAIPLGISIWWFALFMLKSVRLQFAAGGLTASAVVAPGPISVTTPPDARTPATYAAAMQAGAVLPTSASHKIPASIIVIAIFLLLGVPGMVFSFAQAIRFRLPFVLLGLLVTGWKSTAILVAMGIVQLILGIALLRRKAWSLDPAIAYAVFVTLNSFLFVVSPARDAYFSLIFRNYPVPQSLPPDFMMHMMRVIMPFSMIFGIALNLVALYFLITRRAAYRAACTASNTCASASR